MSRKLRIEYPGAIYHILSRGNRREVVFPDETDYLHFVQTLEEACRKTAWQVHAFCLMPNHFHLVIETPQANLVAGMKWLLSTFTNRFNRRHAWFGHLFSGRYKSLLVDGSGSGYLRSVSEYVHLNPARARLLNADQPLHDYRWSSYPKYLKPSEERPAWLRVDRVLGEAGIPKDSVAGRREYAAQIELRRREGDSEKWDELRRGWFHGSAEFKLELLRQMNEPQKILTYGKPPFESLESQAETLVQAQLKALDWTDNDLMLRKKTDPEKVAMAKRLRRETVMPLRWIAKRLHAGTVNTLRNVLLSGGPVVPRSAAIAGTSLDAEKPPASHPLAVPKKSTKAESFSVVWD